MARFKIRLKKGIKRKTSNSARKQFSYKKAGLIFSCLIICIIFWFAYLFYIKSPYFVVENLILAGEVATSRVNYVELENMVKNKNIFRLNLGNIRDYMLANYQELLDLKLTRTFPNSIIAVTKLRKPVAQLYQKHYYPVDEEGVILSWVTDSPHEQLPIISGVQSDLSEQLGTMSDSKRIKKALSLLQEIDSSGILKGHTLVEIDISNIRNAIFFLEDGLEVKIGNEEYGPRLETLKKILQDPKIKPADIRYIDLRFKEPVIGPKWKR